MSESNGAKGLKFDYGKPDLSLLPLSALEAEARGFMFGAGKYGRWNYTRGLEASRLVAASLRHITAWNQGEDRDSESGVHHLGHARCCLAMILECARLGTLIDDRNLVRMPESGIHVPQSILDADDHRRDVSFSISGPATAVGGGGVVTRTSPLDFLK